MPNYEYKCNECGEVQMFTCKMSELDERKPKQCTKCGSDKISQVYGNVGISYNCTGFYTTDSR